MAIKMKELNQMIKSYCSLFFIALLSINLTVEAQGKFEGSVNNSPLDNSIRYGRLPNGFSYFIKSVSGPQSKLHLRFYNKAGYNQQDPDQLNIAHAVEHLAYKATQNFPKGIANSERIDNLEMKMYDYVAAFSGNRSTHYSFDAPANNNEALEVGLLFFKDIAMGLKLTEADINSVRGELRQEFLEGGGDSNSKIEFLQLRSKIFPCRQDYSNFLEYHENFSSEIVRRFYKDWYRPDLLAISAVGNIEDIDNLEQRIKNTFSDLKPVENLRKLKNCDSLYYNRPPQFFIVKRPTDPTGLFPDRSVNLQMIFRDPLTNRSLNTLKGMERLILIQLTIEIVNKRLREATMGYNSFDAGVRDSYLYEELPVTMMVDAKFENTNEKEVVQKIMKVINQLQKYGVTVNEWNELKQKRHQYLETPGVENSNYWINGIKKFYDNAEALPANKNIYLQQWLFDLSQIEYHEFLSEFLEKQPEDIGIIAPTGHQAHSLTEKKVRKWIKTSSNSIKPYKPCHVPEILMSNEEIASLKETKIVDLGMGKSGAREFILINGLKLVVKPLKATSNSYKDNLMIHGFALRGTSCFAEEDFFSIINAPYIIRNAGVNGMDKFEVNSFLTKNNMLPGVVSSYIDVDEIGIQGTAKIKNLEILLQLIYLHFTNPNKDVEAFEDWKRGIYKSYKNPSDLDFKNMIKKVTGDSSLVEEVLGYKFLKSGTDLYLGIDKIDIDVAYNRYQELFSNAKEFTFVVSGDFELEIVLPVLVKYLGNLPNPSSSDVCIPAPKNGDKLPEGPLFHDISVPGNYEIKNVNYGINFIKAAANPLDWQEQIKVEALGEVSTYRIWDLRFEKGYSLYSVGVNARLNKDMNRYEIKSYFKCVPKEFPMIRKEVHQIISDLKSGKISKELFRKGMDRMLTLYDSKKKAGTHPILHKNLYENYRYGEPYVDPEEVEKFVKSLTLEDIKETAKKYYQDKNFYEFVLMNRKVE